MPRSPIKWKTTRKTCNVVQVIDRDTRQKLAQLAASARATPTRSAFREAAREVAIAERSAAPRKSGSLRASIKWFLLRRSAPSALAWFDVSRAPHAHLVIRGTKGRREPAAGKMLKLAIGRGSAIFRRSVAPMPANDFVSPTVDRVAPGAVRALVARIQGIVNGIK